MISPISIKEKKQFLKWFLNHYELKRADCIYILEHLIHHERLLLNVHFVRDVINYPKGILMTCNCSKGIDFQFHKNHVMTNNVDQSFHELRLHPDERMYIQLNFYDVHINQFYQTIAEDRYFSDENKRIRNQDAQVAATLLNKITNDYKLKQLKSDINKALDSHDKSSFLLLSNEWNEITKNSTSKRID